MNLQLSEKKLYCLHIMINNTDAKAGYTQPQLV